MANEETLTQYLGTLSSDPEAGVGPRLAATGPPRPLRQRVFEWVRAAGVASRAELTRELDISAGSATQITADLIARGLLEEVDSPPREAARGRPPTALRVVPDSGFVLGVKLAEEEHSAVITDFSGQERGSASLASRPQRRGIPALTNEVSALVDRVLTDAGVTLEAVSAIGLGLPGLVDHAAGTVAWSPLLADRDLPLAAMLTEHLGRPVLIDNDVNMLTLAELWFGVGRQMSDFAVVTIEQGLGMGLVLNNQLYRGARGMGLELGHTKVQPDGALCRCGSRGCLEAYVADYALVREASTALDLSPRTEASPQAMLDALFAEAHAGNAAALTIFRRAGRYLSLGLANVVQLFDPGLIILSGAQMRHEFLFAEDVLAEVDSLSLDRGRAPARVEIHRWGDLVWARGATALALASETERRLGSEAA